MKTDVQEKARAISRAIQGAYVEAFGFTVDIAVVERCVGGYIRDQGSEPMEMQRTINALNKITGSADFTLYDLPQELGQALDRLNHRQRRRIEGVDYRLDNDCAPTGSGKRDR